MRSGVDTVSCCSRKNDSICVHVWLVSEALRSVGLTFLRAHCLLQFEDPRDANDAVRGRDGVDFQGQRLRVSRINSAHGMLCMAPWLRK